MRELPYLISLIKSIKPEVCHRYISEVVAYDKKLLECKDFEGQKIIDILRYGRYVHFQLSQDGFLVDLSNEGAFILTDEDKYKDSVLKISTEEWNLFITDKDTNIIPVWKDHTILPPVGYDPLTKQFNYNVFLQILEDNKGITVDKLLQNELILSGIGEEFAGIILKRAGLTKKSKTDSINKEAARDLFDVIKDVLHKAVGASKEEDTDDSGDEDEE